MTALRLQDVVFRDDANHGRMGSAILGHRKVVKVLLHDRRDERRQRGLLIDGEHRRAHDLGDESRNVSPLADDLRAEVGVGHDAKRPPVLVDDQNRADVALAHHRGGGANGRLSVASQHVAHRVHAAHVVARLCRPLVTPRVPHRDEPIGLSELRDVGRKVGRKEHRHPGRLGYQRVQLVLRQNVKQGVVFCLRGSGVWSISEKRSNAKDVTVVADVDENIVAVDALTHLDLAFDQNVELRTGHAALLEDDLAGLQIPNANPSWRCGREARDRACRKGDASPAGWPP